MSESISEDVQLFQKLLESHCSVSVVSHIYPDADAIGTALGVYHWIKEQGIRVEVANASKETPRYLDFLPGFEKIKQKLDFDDSLIISCDCGSLDRIGFDVSNRTIVNIDHHPTSSMYGNLNIVDECAASSSQVAYRLFRQMGKVSQESAVNWYAALLSDTRNFTTSSVNGEVFALANELIALGVDAANVAAQMIQRRSLASLRVLADALASLRLYHDAQVACMCVTREDMEKSGAKASDLDGIVDYAKSLATVRVACMLVERSGSIKVSLRSKQIDLTDIAEYFKGGGHRHAVGFEVSGCTIAELNKLLMQKIIHEGIVS